jgi:predicted transcriptional regulator
MSSMVITFEAPEESIATVDEIAANLGVDRAAVVREAVAQFVGNYQELNADIDEARRQIDAGQFTLHEDVVQEFQHKAEKSRAA